jgi:multidrug resistance efflux pump
VIFRHWRDRARLVAELAAARASLATFRQDAAQLTAELEQEKAAHAAAVITSDLTERRSQTEIARLRRDLHISVTARRTEREEVVNARTRVMALRGALDHANARLDRLPTDLGWAAAQADREELRHLVARRDTELEQLRAAFLANATGPVTVLAADPDFVDVAALQARVDAAYAFADELAGYCSPHGVSARYADRLRQRLDQAVTQQKAGA